MRHNNQMNTCEPGASAVGPLPMYFLQPSPLLTPEVASNLMHIWFLIRGFSFTQHLTWELPTNYCGWFFVCLIVFGGDRGKMSFVLQCFQTRAPPQIIVCKMLRPTISLEEGLLHVNEEYFSANM